MYTSGRTVKSSKARPTTIATATADARKLVRKHLPAYANATITSKLVAGLDGVVRMGTTITYALDTDHAALVDAVLALPGYHSISANRVAVEYLRTI